MSCVMCHVTRVTCLESSVTFFLVKLVDLVGGGSVINGAYPVRPSKCPKFDTNMMLWELNLVKIFNTLHIPNCRSWAAEILRECSPPTMCHMSCVRCQVPGVKCFFLFLFIFIFFWSHQANRGKVCYQRGLPRIGYSRIKYLVKTCGHEMYKLPWITSRNLQNLFIVILWLIYKKLWIESAECI